MNLTTVIVVAVVVIVVAAIAVTASMMMRKRHSERLREQFGPEYDRTLRESDDPREAEKELQQRRKRHRTLELRELGHEEREGYRDRWSEVQGRFVDDPGSAVRDADSLVVDVMSARGYPVDDFDRRAEDLSVEYPVVTQRYREARAISREHEAGTAGTEDLRQAVTSYRALVTALLDDTDDGSGRSDEDGRRREHGKDRDDDGHRDGDGHRNDDGHRDGRRDGDDRRDRGDHRDDERDHGERRERDGQGAHAARDTDAPPETRHGRDGDGPDHTDDRREARA